MATHKHPTQPARPAAIDIRARIVEAYVKEAGLAPPLASLLKGVVAGERGQTLCARLGVSPRELELLVSRFRTHPGRDLYDASTNILLESVRKTPKTPLPPKKRG